MEVDEKLAVAEVVTACREGMFGVAGPCAGTGMPAGFSKWSGPPTSRGLVGLVPSTESESESSRDVRPGISTGRTTLASHMLLWQLLLIFGYGHRSGQ
jgi:hypothetical protein